MLVIRIELWPGGSEKRKREIGLMEIVNRADHPDRPKRGNYVVYLMRRGASRTVQRRCTVEDYPRESYPVWELVRRALNTLYGRKA